MQIKNKGYLVIVSIFTLVLALMLVWFLGFGWVWGTTFVSLLTISEICLYIPQVKLEKVGGGLANIGLHIIFMFSSWGIFMLVASKLMYEQQNPSGIFYVPALAAVVLVGRMRILGIFAEVK